MRYVRVKCRNTKGSSLMMDPMSKEKLIEILRGTPRPVVRDKPLEEMAAEKIYTNEEGRIGLPVRMLRKSLILAGTLVSLKGRTNVTRATDGATKLPSFLWFEDNFLVFTNIPKGKSLEELRKKGYWEVNLDRGAQTQGRGKGGASALVRPEFSKWEFTVTIRYDENRVNEEVIKKLFVEAGKTQGLGAARPNRGLDHGQFEVVEFTDITEQYAEKQLKTAAM